MSYWNIKVYDDSGEERETLRGLTYARVNTLMQVFEREGVEAQAQKYDDEGERMEDSWYVDGEDGSVELDDEELDDLEAILKDADDKFALGKSIKSMELRNKIQRQRGSW